MLECGVRRASARPAGSASPAQMDTGPADRQQAERRQRGCVGRLLADLVGSSELYTVVYDTRPVRTLFCI